MSAGVTTTRQISRCQVGGVFLQKCESWNLKASEGLQVFVYMCGCYLLCNL